MTEITQQQQKYLDAVSEHGSIRAAAKALGLNESTIRNCLARAARLGRAPGHFNDGVAPGYFMGKVTVQRTPNGVERTWERQHPDAAETQRMMRAMADELSRGIKRVKAIPAPKHVASHLCNLFTLTDSHVGMRAWHKENGEADWDLGIAEEVLVGCFEHMVKAAPNAEVAFVNQLGDFLHSDGLSPITPTSHHVLDQDGRFGKVVAVAIRIIRRIVELALAKHSRVVLLLAEGNHDMASSVWLRAMFAALYENEPRVEVISSEMPYYAYKHGKTMLAFHHGHMKKNQDLPLLFAAQFAPMWGATTKRYCHVGHRHHVEEKDHSGMRVIQHATLAARDAYASRGGWISERQAEAMTFHSEYGIVSRNVTTPEMLTA